MAALLYDELGKDPDRLVEGVKACLEALKNARWVVEEEGKYRFLSEAEHSFEEKVSRQIVIPAERQKLAKEIWREALKELKRYNHRNLRSLDVAVTVDDDEITREGYLKLVVSSPLKSGEPSILLKWRSPHWLIGRPSTGSLRPMNSSLAVSSGSRRLKRS
ncbi:MAG: hypothetical protein HY347_04835 [candidate division NC10 bacterium]|nr:hypothetical protein [candidate division NC10 bacterium]